jgi:hypothetical protein
MREFPKFTLKELENDPARMSRAEMRATLAGGDGKTAATAVTSEEYYCMLANGTWEGGYVEGWGFVNAVGMGVPGNTNITVVCMLK